MKLEIYNYFPDTTPHAKFQGPMSTWVVWANSQFDIWRMKVSVLFCFLTEAIDRIILWTRTRAQYVIICRSGQGIKKD